VFGDARQRAAQHARRDVDADDAIAGPVAQERNAGAEADFKNTSAAGADMRLGGGDSSHAALLENAPEHHVVDWRPAIVGLLDRVAVERHPHGETKPPWPSPPRRG
jgi:hypothetical protein